MQKYIVIQLSRCQMQNVETNCRLNENVIILCLSLVQTEIQQFSIRLLGNQDPLICYVE